MTLRIEASSFDELKLIKYIFEEKNDILPLHSHNKETQHITIVLKGVVHLSGPNLNKILKNGQIYDYSDDEQTHEIISLQDDTVILNIPKKYNQYLKEKQTEEELKQEEELQKQYQEEYRKNQLEQMLKTEQESNTHK